MTLESAILRGLAVAPLVALWAVLPRNCILDRLTLAACRVAYPVTA